MSALYLNSTKVPCYAPSSRCVVAADFIGESDRWQHQPLYEAIVLKAREMHLAGATVLRGPMGFGKSSRLHTAKIVDTEDKINSFLPVLDEMLQGGLVTLEKVRVIDYRAESDAEIPPKT